MATFVKDFMGTTLAAATNGSVTTARRGGTQVKKGTQVKRSTKKVTRKVAPKKGTQVKRSTKKSSGKKSNSSNFGPNRPLWYPMRNGPPAWLDGSMIGDRGFDPLGLGKPAEYLQFELDELDGSAAKNFAGTPLGRYIPDNTTVTEETLQPYNEVFDINRFRECELIHGRWCMVATLGALVAEAATGVSWIDAGKVQLEGANYLGFPIPYSLTQLVALEVLLVGYIEIARSSELDNTKRCYPGGRFDPFNLASGENAGNADNLKLAEIKHGRLAMVAFLGFALEAAFLDGASPLEVAGF